MKLLILTFSMLTTISHATDIAPVRLLTCDRWTYFFETRSWSCTAQPREIFVTGASNKEAIVSEIEAIRARLNELEKMLAK